MKSLKLQESKMKRLDDKGMSRIVYSGGPLDRNYEQIKYADRMPNKLFMKDAQGRLDKSGKYVRTSMLEGDATLYTWRGREQN